MEVKQYIVYSHTNKLNGKKYIGITCQTPSRRWRNGNGYHRCEVFHRAILKYGWEEFTHDILFTNLTKSEAEEKEMCLIEKYNTLVPNGYNIQNGGNTCGTHSDYTKEKLRQANLGKTHSLEARLKMSKTRKGVPHSEAHTKKYIGSNNPNAKKTGQFDLKGNLIAVWGCAEEASQFLNLKPCNIRSCCREERKHSGGFIWRYVNGD